MAVAAMKLPNEYLANMRTLLGEAYGDFIEAYEEEPVRGLRFNRAKARQETIEKLKAYWGLEPVPWCSLGYYYANDIRPGLSPYHDAGVFYIQEPSAMITAEEADIKADDIVLDLCAAPGGKATQAAAGARLLIANEPAAGRARVLSSNIERLGLKNCIVTSAYPEELAGIFINYFDKIIVDAPCSGEGMMRRDETAVKEWSPDNVRHCAARQAGILDAAAGMLKAGGCLVYSTCTFEPSENENQARAFTLRHPEFTIVSMKRLMPHEVRGEGHFCAVFKKKNGEMGSGDAVNCGEKAERCADDVCGSKEDCRHLIGELKRLLVKKRVHVLRAGVEPGELKKDRKGREFYTPSHAEAMARDYNTDSGARINILSEELCMRYLKGEELRLDEAGGEGYRLETGQSDSRDVESRTGDGGENAAAGDTGAGNVRGRKAKAGEISGWVTVYYDGYPLGNGKLVGNTLKNHYPKGLRRL